MTGNVSLSSYSQHCFFFGANFFIYTTVNIGNIIIILPLSSFVLYDGFQKWLQKGSASAMSHLDTITYHMVVIELVGVCKCFLILISVFTKDWNLLEMGFIIFFLIWYGQGFFHLLTCVERYLAVVHPVMYLKLRNKRGIRIRNISIGCVWLLSFVMLSFMKLNNVYMFSASVILIIYFAVVSFCCLSVLCVLIRPGPGEQAVDRVKVDQSKQKAFYTIAAILGVLIVKFSWALIWVIGGLSKVDYDCVMIISEFFFNLPSSLVLPLLFLQRKRRFVCCKNGIQ